MKRVYFPNTLTYVFQKVFKKILPDLLAKKPVNDACLIIPPNAVCAAPFGGCSAGGEAGFLTSWLGVSADVGTGGGGTFGFETSFSGNGDFGFGGCTFNTLG